MTPRPALAKKSRPLSAIFIGSAGSTPPALPDLPEPPSPSTSSTSGLPSPPATNSTGSGSVGEGSTNAGSLRHRTPKLATSTSSMSGGGFGDKFYEYRKKRSSAIVDEDDADENENDEDNTARLDLRRRSFTKGADNASALQRVKTLTERNRMVLDKLTSISRIGSPAPSTTRGRSPLSPPTASSTSSSASATSSSHKSSSQNRPPSVTNATLNARLRDTQLSGSETERESQRHSTCSTSSDDRTTPPPTSFPLSEARGFASVRQRRISAPASPGKVRATTRDKDHGSPGPSRTPRKRVSVMSVDGGHARFQSDDDDDDVTTAALAAVASSRRSPTGSGGKKGRQPLPKEFRNRKLSDEKTPNLEPATPHRSSNRAELGRGSPSPRKTRVTASDPPESPRRLGQSRYSTVRELTRKHQMRWMSEDLSSPSRERPEQSFDGPGRRQGHRTGSSEGLLGTAGGRSLVGEGLRAAGLTKRRDEDVFISTNGGAQASTLGQRTRSNGTSSIISSEGDSSFNRSLEEGSRVDEGVGPPRDPKTPINASMRARPQSGVPLRPGTSMAALHHDESAPPRTAPPALRTYRSTYTLQDRNVEDLQRQAQERSSPYATVRSSTAQSGIRETNGDHRRLMLEALTMFESHLSRLPPMGQTTTSTIPEVFQSAQHLVHSLDKLNAMLKEGTNKALEAQIDAELADYKDGVDLPELWREVGSDHRENLRVSDEVVRNMTGFLLGVGKILREATSGTQHLRTMSLDEEVTRRSTPDIQLNGNGREVDGRRSSLRRSWEPGKETARLMRLSTGLEESGRMGSRPGSSMNVMRSSTTTSSSEGRSVTEANDGTPATVRQSAPISASTSAARRLYTPRDRVDSNAIPLSPDEFGILGDYEPSPTPLSRQSHAPLPNHRALPSLAVAPSLPTLPSESLLTRSTTSAASTDKLSRRKISASSIVTVRPEPTPFTPSIKPSNPTTAVTTATVSLSPENGAAPFPLLRSESGSSSRSNGVTFSRPSTTSVSSTLTGLQQQHERGARNRKVSFNSIFADRTVAPTVYPSAAISSPQSGSESERERDRDRESRSRTISARPRASMEASRGEASPVEAVRRSLATTVSYSAARKERRRTITEIFSHR